MASTMKDILFLVKNLEETLNILYFSEKSQERWEAQKYLNEFQNKTDCWRINCLIIRSQNKELVFYGLSLLDRLVSFSWNSVPEREKKEIQNFIINWILDFTTNLEAYRNNLSNLNKLNLILAKIVCQSTKKNFFYFLSDLISSAKKTEIICENSLRLIYYIFDEIFSNPNFEQTRNIYQNDFRFEESLVEIKNLCFFVIKKNEVFFFSNSMFLQCVLRTFKKILEISPNGFLIQKDFIDILILLCFYPQFGNDSIKCLIEIFSSKKFSFDCSFFDIKYNFIIQFLEVFPISSDWVKFFILTTQECKDFLKNSTLFLLSFVEKLIEENVFEFFESECFLISGKIILKLSCLPDFEIFKICVDWWETIISLFEFRKKYLQSNDRFSVILEDFKTVLIGRMPKPEEVLIIEGDFGEMTQESAEDTDAKNFHAKSKNLLSILTKRESLSTRKVLLKKMENMINHQNPSKKILNTLSWSVGAISEILPPKIEDDFLIIIIKDLLFLCEIKKGKENKALVASNIMYVVGQYPRFLKAHFKFLRAVLLKLFEFMHEKCLGIKDMACDTFFKIGNKCSSEIVNVQENEEQSLLEELLESINETTKFLEFRQISVFYKTIGTMIERIEDDQKRNSYLTKIFQIFLHKWNSQLKPNILSDKIQSLSETRHFLKINIEIGKILKKKYYLQIKTLFRETFFLFEWTTNILRKKYSEIEDKILISNIYQEIKMLRGEVLEICEIYLMNCILNEKSLFTTENCKILCESIFRDYKDSMVPDFRENKIIEFCIKVMNEAKSIINNDFIILIFSSIFIPSQEMLKKNFEDFPEIRKSFFYLLKNLIENFFHFIFKLDQDAFKSEKSFELIVHTIIWGFKHPDYSISLQNLYTCLFFLKSIENEHCGNYFYPKFFKQIFSDLIWVMTDKLHISSLKIQCILLSLLIKNGKNFFDQNYLKFYIKSILNTIFPDSDKIYLENLLILFFLENNTENIRKEFKKLLKSSFYQEDENESN